MPVAIWTRLSLDVLKEELIEAGLSLSRFKFLSRPQDISRAEIILGQFPVRSEAMAGCLRWVQLDSVDASDTKPPAGVVVSSIKGVFARHVAETTMGALLGYYRGLFQCRDLQPKKNWQRWPIRSTLETLTGKNVVILGGGVIAGELIRLLKPFGCAITIYRRSRIAKAGALVITSKAALRKYLRSADVLVSTLPASASTANFVSAGLLRDLRSHCVFVNVGRGATVDEDALLKALRARKLRAAILDVTRVEPLPASNSLWRAPNAFLTQHTAGGDHQEERLKCRFFVGNLTRYLRNAPLQNLVTL
jgi:glyoxylate/hydroxypyruvate reductase